MLSFTCKRHIFNEFFCQFSISSVWTQFSNVFAPELSTRTFTSLTRMLTMKVKPPINLQRNFYIDNSSARLSQNFIFVLDWILIFTLFLNIFLRFLILRISAYFIAFNEHLIDIKIRAYAEENKWNNSIEFTSEKTYLSLVHIFIVKTFKDIKIHIQL